MSFLNINSVINVRSFKENKQLKMIKEYCTWSLG